MKNYSELIKCPRRRWPTAKGVKFIWKCVGILADSKGLHVYAPQFKAEKQKLKALVEHCIFDKRMSQAEIIEAIKNRTVNHGLNE